MAIQLNVTIAGQTSQVKAMAYSALPKKGHAQATGKLNGQAYTFVLTKGQGRGTVMQYVAYFVLDAKIYYFYTGAAFLQSGVEVQVVEAQATPASVVEAPAAPAAPVKAPKAPRTPRKAKVAA